jgi:hypothetical protein
LLAPSSALSRRRGGKREQFAGSPVFFLVQEKNLSKEVKKTVLFVVCPVQIEKERFRKARLLEGRLHPFKTVVGGL